MLKPAELLTRIAKQGNNVQSAPKTAIVVGNRMRNMYLRNFVRILRNGRVKSDAEILDYLLYLDQVIEDGMLTDEILKFIRKNPAKFNEIFKNKK